MSFYSTKSLLLNGSTQYCTGGDVLGSVLEYNVAWSISLWRKTSGPAGMWIAKGDDSSPYKGLQFYGAGNVVVQAISAPGSAATFSTGTGLDDGAWHHVVLTKAAGASVSGGDWHIYVDGVDQTLTPSQDNLTGSILTTFPFLVGEWGSVNPYPFNGSLDEVAVYDKALNSAEVLWLFNAGIAGDLKDVAAPSNLKAWWHMGEDLAINTIPDQEGLYNLTVVGSPTVQDDAPGLSLYQSYYEPYVDPGHTWQQDTFSVYDSEYEEYVDPDHTWKQSFYGEGGPTFFYKMRARDTGVAAPGYVSWVAQDDPDFGGTGFSSGSPTPVGIMVPGSATVVARWEE